MPRIAVIEKEKCNPHACGNYLCIRLCPVNREGHDCIVVGEDRKALIYESMCTGCGICVTRCPFGAIKIINLPDELASKPLHQYGENSFRLYNTPIPKPNQIIGLLGRNGMGKSTLMQILSGQLTPNLGDHETKGSWDAVIALFKGSEAQSFFERLRDSGVSTALKPQLVEQIPKVAKGSVRELLLAIDANGFERVAQACDLLLILDRTMEQLSGGELQRVAIAAALLRDPELLLVDEPSSYLDIKQRIRIARLLNEEKHKRMMVVVEHDLLVLDYLADTVHLVYGLPKAYGIIALPRAARNGINAYLEGYVKEENIRFRDKPITYRGGAEKTLAKQEELVRWESHTHAYDSFSLSIEPGAIRKKEVVGIVGENATGKSTFIKLLAGELEGFGTDLRIAYKPQYLPRERITVSEYLKDAFEKHRRTLIIPLELEELEFREVDSLSGGELQRVAIARTLSEDADLYLLDEPSAYLDVEQRLAASRAIRSFIDETEKSAFIVDHDLLFIDIISDSIMVFSGAPSVSATTAGPMVLRDGLNAFLRELEVTVRRDHDSGRPRINKPGSVLDREQRSSGEHYASS
ncbi:MAG: ribosome biogenesis/translation initiation ATPase RLI [Candidatus Woesearchaeota archaeon]